MEIHVRHTLMAYSVSHFNVCLQLFFRTTSRVQTFYDGAPNSPPGVCHIPMEPAYCPFMPKLVSESAQALKLKIHRGVTCVVIEGPRYSSLAESKMYRFLGGDVINMTNLPEVI